MIKEDIIEKRKQRHKITQEDFTPDSVLDIMLKDVDQSLYIDFKKTFCDPCCGTGNIYIYILKKRLEHCKNDKDVYNAVQTMYGTELMEDNVEECKQKVITLLLRWSASKNINLEDRKIISIIDKNIICADTFNWDYDNWNEMSNQNKPYGKNLKKDTQLTLNL